MRFLLTAVLLIVLAVPAVAQDGLLFPALEKIFTVSEGWRFAGPSKRDDAPNWVEVKADGEIRVTWFTGGGAPKYGGGTATEVVIGTPTWGSLADTTKWPDSVPVGNDYLTADSDLGRIFYIRGTNADSLGILLITATKAVVTCSKER